MANCDFLDLAHMMTLDYLVRIILEIVKVVRFLLLTISP